MTEFSFNRIVVCDDDAPFRRRLCKSLRDRNLTVFEASSAEDFLDAIKTCEVEAALLDLRMPGNGGLWGLQEALKQSPGLKVVVLTGFGSITTAIEAVKFGAVNYLTKPTSVERILAAFSPEHTPEEKSEEALPPLEEVQKEYINRVLAEFQGNISRSAKVLGLHRRSLQRFLHGESKSQTDKKA